MSRKYRAAVIGLAHMHIDHNAQLFASHPQVQPVALADTIPDRPELRESTYTRAWNIKHCIKLGYARRYDDYHELLDRETPDIILCCAENTRRAEVVEAAAAASAHILVEKPLAASMPHALRMARAARLANVALLTNWPTLWEPVSHLAKKLIDQGAIGNIIQVKWRAGHTGPLGPGVKHPGIPTETDPLSPAELAATWWHHDATGGGAMLDYCCYGALFARWFIGQNATAAIGMRGNFNSQWSDADDNGYMLARFPSAVGLFEGSWTQLDSGVPQGPIVFGQTGTLVIDTRDGQKIVRIERGHGQTETHTPDPLPADADQVQKQMIRQLDGGQPADDALQLPLNLDVVSIMDAAYRSTESNRLELVNNPAWTLGEG